MSFAITVAETTLPPMDKTTSPGRYALERTSSGSPVKLKRAAERLNSPNSFVAVAIAQPDAEFLASNLKLGNPTPLSGEPKPVHLP
jgi:hypothetical protein